MRSPQRASGPTARVSYEWPKRCEWRASRLDGPWTSAAALDLLLDALAELVPSLAERVHGVERFPPPAPERSRSPNYHVGSIADLDGPFDAGVCIEVIEHLTSTILASLLRQLAGKSSPARSPFFPQPSFVEAAYTGHRGPTTLAIWLCGPSPALE